MSIPDVNALPDVEEDAYDAAAEFARDVEREAYGLRVRDAARVKVTAEKAGPLPELDAGTLAAMLARPAEPPHRVGGLIPSEGGTLVVAQRKTGKTTLTLNLARCLLTGEDFLARFPVRPVTGNVAVLNYEVSGSQLARWAHEAGVPEDRLLIVNLRGRRNPLAYPEDRARLAELLAKHDVESLFVDPFGRAYTGQSQNDPGEVGAWLAELDRFARGEANAVDVVLSTHAGWNGERTRGASSLEDWADSVVTLTRDPDDETLRFLRAEGRDVEIEEDRLAFDPTTRRLTLTGKGSRKQAAANRQAAELLPQVVEYVREHPDCSQAAIERGVEGRAAAVRAAVGAAVEAGQIDREKRSKGWVHRHLVPPRPTPSRTSLVTSSPRL